MKLSVASKTPTKENQVNLIVENFDYEKVSKTMKALDWKYFDSSETPTVGRLVMVSIDLLNSAYSEAVRSYSQPYVTISSGGFVATARRFDEDIILELAFNVASIDVRELVDC
jgi:hypothetical protein